MNNNCIFQLVLFIAIGSLLSVAFAQDVDVDMIEIEMTRAKSKSTVECALQSCTDVKNCTCPILNYKGKLKDSYLASCTNNRCEYCAKFVRTCSFGSKSDPTKNGQIPCCDTIGKDRVKKDVVCAETYQKDGLYRCIERCLPVLQIGFSSKANTEKKRTCYDKDGYFVTGYPVQCSGTKSNTVVTCNGEKKYAECGITGADCSGAIKCCKTYKCIEGKCTRTCFDRGGKCNMSANCCYKNVKDGKKCSKETGSTFKCVNNNGDV